MRRSLTTYALLASMTVLPLTGCGDSGADDAGPTTTTSGDSTESTSAPDVDVVEVTIRTFLFDPDPLRVPTGTTVRFVNEDPTTHTVTAGSREAPTPEVFDESLAEGDSTEITFNEPGRQPYFCEIHQGPGMTAEVIVE